MSASAARGGTPSRTQALKESTARMQEMVAAAKRHQSRPVVPTLPRGAVALGIARRVWC